MIKLFPVS